MRHISNCPLQVSISLKNERSKKKIGVLFHVLKEEKYGEMREKILKKIKKVM
jgi:hypothetical protein